MNDAPARFHPDPTPESVLALIQRMRTDLQAIEDPREAATIVRQADAIKYLSAKAQASADVQNQAAEVALRAKRRAGEVLSTTVERGRPTGNSVSVTELNIDQNDSKRWQAVASIPEDRFESYVSETMESGRELTTAGALAIAREERDGGNMGVHYSSSTPEWSTPDALFKLLDSEFHFELDVCATPENAKCERYFTRESDGLFQNWKGVCWMNPPYGASISQWVFKAWASSKMDAMVVCLVPARVDTAWWWDYARLGEVRFLRGRLRFGEAAYGAPFPSAVVIFEAGRPASVVWWERWP